MLAMQTVGSSGGNSAALRFRIQKPNNSFWDFEGLTTVRTRGEGGIRGPGTSADHGAHGAVYQCVALNTPLPLHLPTPRTLHTRPTPPPPLSRQHATPADPTWRLGPAARPQVQDKWKKITDEAAQVHWDHWWVARPRPGHPGWAAQLLPGVHCRLHCPRAARMPPRSLPPARPWTCLVRTAHNTASPPATAAQARLQLPKLSPPPPFCRCAGTTSAAAAACTATTAAAAGPA